MAFTRLSPRRVEKLWGRRDLPPPFGPIAADREPVGEIIFDDPLRPDAELLIKYLFTSEPLSIQVHPDDAAARRRGLPRGKNEAWYIVDAADGAVIGLGVKAPVGKEELRRASLDGSVAELIDWRPVRKDELLYAPAGTVHAIGAGIALIEVQQNVDVTYRLFDYGRPRALQLDDALEVARTEPSGPAPVPAPIDRQRVLLCDAGDLAVERWSGPLAGTLRLPAGKAAWLVPLSGGMTIDGEPLERGVAGTVEGAAAIALDAGAVALVGHGAGGPLDLAA